MSRIHYATPKLRNVYMENQALMKTIEQRMKAMEEMIIQIHAVMVLGKKPAPPDVEQWRHAYEAFATGDNGPLSLCIKRNGGIIPEPETIYPDAAVQRGGSNAPSRYRPRASGRNGASVRTSGLQGAGCRSCASDTDGGRRSANLPTAATTPSSSPGP